MTEKLFTGMLNKNQNKNKTDKKDSTVFGNDFHILKNKEEVIHQLRDLMKCKKPEDQWSCKRSPDYFSGINTTVKREKGATLIF